MALTLTITDEKLQQAFEESMEAMLVKGNYSNPVKSTLDSLLGYSGSMKGELGSKISEFLSTALESHEFQAMLGKSIAEEMARRAVDAMEKKK